MAGKPGQMRILIVHNILNDSTSVNGVLRHFTTVANEWTAQGHPTDFLLAKAGWPQVRQLSPNSRLFSSDSFFNATAHLGQSWRNFPAYAYRLVSAHWNRLTDPYDIVYSSTPAIFDVYPSLVLSRRKRARFAVKLHHILYAQPGRGGFLDNLYLWTERMSTRLTNRKADCVVCSTDIVARDYHRLEAAIGLHPRKTHQIAYGLDMEKIKPRWDQPKIFDAVSLGRMHEHKGVFELPEVWHEVVRHLPSARLLVIGEGPHRQRTADMFAQRGLQHTVQFTGGVSETQKNEYLTQARIGISLSYEEGWGLSITEFLAAGLPVIAYELPVYALAFPGHVDLVPPKSPVPMARKIVELLKAPEVQLTRGREGRRFVERYDYRKIAAAELQAIRGDTLTTAQPQE